MLFAGRADEADDDYRSRRLACRQSAPASRRNGRPPLLEELPVAFFFCDIYIIRVDIA